MSTRPEPPMMKCGHAANAEDREGNPVCVICVGIDPGAKVVNESPPDLAGRQSRCPDCKKLAPSNPNLPFFAHRPTLEYDQHYDGCRGWD